MTSNYGNCDYQVCEDMDKISELPPPKTQKLVGFKFLLSLTEVVGLLLIVLMIIWTMHFRGGFAWTSDPDHQFNWHPLLMTIGLVFLYANGMLIYRWQRNIRKRRLKLIHGGIMILTFLLTIIGLMSVFDMHNLKTPPIPNMYTLHSWVGLTSVVLFVCQWLIGFVSFLYPGIESPLRSIYLPIHIFFGIAGFIGVILSCLLGLSEKVIFTLGVEKYSEFVAEGVFINVMGMVLIVFGGLTVYLVTREDYKRESKDEDNILLTGVDD